MSRVVLALGIERFRAAFEWTGVECVFHRFAGFESRNPDELIFEHVELDQQKICPPAAFVFRASAFWRAARMKAIDRSLFLTRGWAGRMLLRSGLRRAMLERRSPKAQNSHELTGRCLY